MSTKKKVNIGIDLGTTYSCASVIVNDTLQMIHDSTNGKLTIPSVVHYGPDGTFIVGSEAVHKKAGEPENVFYDSKRLIGRKFDEAKVQKTIANASYKLVRFDESTNAVKTTPGGNTDNMRYVRQLTASEKASGKTQTATDFVAPRIISCEILRKLANNAANVLGERPTHAVITVPAYFHQQQKKTTELAAREAGFDEVRLVTEPVAAAMAYGYHRIKNNDRLKEDKTVMVFDLGGGTLDVSIVLYNAAEDDEVGIAENLASSGDGFLGGRDMDNAIYSWALAEFLKKNPVPATDLKERSKRRLQLECERAKCVLSFSPSATLCVECFHGETDLLVDISRFKFEQLCQPFFKRCIEKVEECMAMYAKGDLEFSPAADGEPVWTNRSKMLSLIDSVKNKIDAVILVGGSSRIPKVQDILKDFFTKDKVIMPINPDEAIAMGAGYHAAQLWGGEAMKSGDKLLLLDATSFTIGIETYGGVMTPLIKKNTPIPASATQIFSTAANNQTNVEVSIFTGEYKMVKDNHNIGRFILSGIEEAPAGVPQIEIKVEMEANGIIKVSAVNKKTNSENKIEITDATCNVSKETEQVSAEIREKARKADEAEFNRVQVMNEYNSLICKTEYTNKEVSEKHRNWLAMNGSASEEVLREKMGELSSESKCGGSGENVDGAAGVENNSE